MNAQSSGGAGLKRQLPPNYKLPNINSLLTEGKKTQRPALPRPPLKPSTLCGYRDVACKRKKEKEKKVGQNFTPSNDDAMQVFDGATRKSDGSWLGRLGRVFSNALSGFASTPAKGNSFFASDLSRNAGNFAPAAFNSTITNAAPAMPPPSFSSIAQAKLDPRYRVGGAGEDLFSGNYNFSLPLVSLPGRAGLDLNITLSYNSLVWIKHSGVMEFDYDYYGTLTPGFRTGFPEIEPPFHSNGYLTYVVYLPSGRRVEMRQAGSNRFEAIDSSYLYLTANPTDTTKLTLHATDGTKYIFEPPNGYLPSRCVQIKDSNGNYISITYKNLGDPEFPWMMIDKITDTLGREIVFNYDGNFHLLSITQDRGGQTFYWAQLDYGAKYVSTNFGSLPVYGPNNTNIPVITRVITADGARHTFAYNSWGQVESIGTYGEADNHRASVIYAFPPTTGASQSDCPRFTQRNDGIFAWPGEVYDQQTGFGWAINYFYFEPNEAYGQVTGPDGVTHREVFSASGNTRGLTTRTETHHGGAIQQFTNLTWLSDSTASPPLRPRVTMVDICDDRNHNGTYESGTDKLRRTVIDYVTLTGTIWMPEIVKEYNEGGGSVYRSVRTEYLTGVNYINNNPYTPRRIVGLPRFTYLYEGDGASVQGKLVSKTEYVYDSANDAETTFLQAHSSAPRQHDNANYGAGFPYRGNLTKTLRYSVNDQGVANSPIETKTGYYITGNVALTKIARDGQTNVETNIFYDDSFSNGVAPNPPTYAYPTKVKDPDNFYSAVKYNYDIGAVTESIDPKNYAISPTNPSVKTVRMYDAKGRLDKSDVWKDGAEYSHTRYVYGPDHNWVQTFTTINSLAEEAAVLHLLDGIGRERIVMNEHPTSQGGLSAYYRAFDKMGRVAEWSRPTEIDAATWAPTGDDSAYIASFQTFDWKGRPYITTHADGSTSRLEYGSCGCAGVNTVTKTDEIGRKQKSYYDAHGRMEKVEYLKSDGVNVYSTETNSYDVRDLLEEQKMIQETAGASRSWVTIYDGYGRKWKTKRPIESNHTVYEYNADNTLKNMTDARGVVTNYSYYNRPLIKEITYTPPASPTYPILPTNSVSFEYDENGNRKKMTSKLPPSSGGTVWGETIYNHDELSRLTSEDQTFNELPGVYKLNYGYNLKGQVSFIGFTSTNRPQDNFTVSYAFDKIGGVIGITGSPFLGFSTYANNMKYAAWGALKSMNYGNGGWETSTFNQNMQIASGL